jgi:hypothetical protein
VPALLSLAGLQNFNGSFNLVFDIEGSVLMASGSVDQKNTYVFEVMPTGITGMSHRYGGIHFRAADLAGRQLGRAVADRVWSKAQSYFQEPSRTSLR